MSDDLVKRLRNEKMGCNLWCEYYDGITTIPLCIEAADHIEKLEAALQFYVCGCNVRCADFKKNSRCGYTARNALEETK